MHPDRATSTLFSGFLVIPTELTLLMKRQGLTKVTAAVAPRPREGKKGRDVLTMDIPLAELPDKIAIPPRIFLEAGYEAGDPVQFAFDGQQLRIGFIAGNAANNVAACEVDDEGVTIPPAWLIQAFTGAPDTIDHIESGRRSADFYVALYNRLCGDFKDIRRVMDFGCGCGRVLSRMPHDANKSYFGVDLRQDALDWLGHTMPEATFIAGSDMPPVDTDERDFDLLYAVSVLTHLTQEQERAWLDEWHRLVRPGGHVIATFRGEDWVERFAYEGQRPAIRQAWEVNGGFCYQKHRYWEGIFPDYYSGTYHTEDYVRSTWGKRFEILEILPAAETPNEQNTAVMRKTT